MQKGSYRNSYHNYYQNYYTATVITTTTTTDVTTAPTTVTATAITTTTEPQITVAVHEATESSQTPDPPRNVAQPDVQKSVSPAISNLIKKACPIASNDRQRKSMNKIVEPKKRKKSFIPRPRTASIYVNQHQGRTTEEWFYGNGSRPFKVNGLTLQQHGMHLIGPNLYCCGKLQQFNVTSLTRHIKTKSHINKIKKKRAPMAGLRRCFHEQQKRQSQPAPEGFKHRGSQVQPVMRMKRLELVRSYMRAGIPLEKFDLLEDHYRYLGVDYGCQHKALTHYISDVRSGSLMVRAMIVSVLNVIKTQYKTCVIVVVSSTRSP